MTRAEALTLLKAMTKWDSPPALTEPELDAFLTLSRTPDNEGRPPSNPDFVEENWDLNYAAHLAFNAKYVASMANGKVTKFSSEGSSFEKEGPDFSGLAEWYLDQSTAGDGGGIAVINIVHENPFYLRPRSVHRC